MATASDNLRDLVKKELRDEWDHSLHGYHEVPSHELRPGQGVSFLPRECCEEDRAIDLKTPHFFKSEYFGRGIIALGEHSVRGVKKKKENENKIKYNAVFLILSGSKTVVAKGDDEKDVKITSKGLQKKRFVDAWQVYKRVLENPRRRDGVTNISFRNFQTKMFTYRQKRLGLRHTYMKRIVDKCGIFTRPLSLRALRITR